MYICGGIKALHVFCIHNGCHSIYTLTCNVNVKHEREKSNKLFSIVSIPFRRERDVGIKREFMPCDVKRERETDRYM